MCLPIITTQRWMPLQCSLDSTRIWRCPPRKGSPWRYDDHIEFHIKRHCYNHTDIRGWFGTGRPWRWLSLEWWSCYENLMIVGRIRPWPVLRFYLGLEEMRKTTINISRDNQCLNRSLNRAPPENKHTDRLCQVPRYKNLCKGLLQKKRGGLEF